MNKNYTATEERIRELVPRLKELSFGCQLKWICSGAYTQIIKVRPQNDKRYLINDWDGGWTMKGIEAEFKIIGHPITLEDVLEAIRISDRDEIDDYHAIGFSIAGYFYKEYSQSDYPSNPENICKWQYGKPFSKQSEATKEFITQLLK